MCHTQPNTDILIGFDPTNYSVNEGDTVARISIVKAGFSNEPITVRLSATDSTAIGMI